MEIQEALEFQWPYLLTLLPPVEELEASAYDTSALSRRRCVDSASTLLRLILAYGFCGFSLRQTAAWAEAAGVASLSDVALLKRFRSSDVWLGQLLAIKLAERATLPSAALRLRLLDATTVSRPGSTGTDWRLHLSFDLARLSIDHFELTDYSVGESLSHFRLAPGEVALADAGYSHRAGLWHVHQSGAAFLVRINWQNTPLRQLDGSPFDILQALRNLPEAAPFGCPVQIAADRSRQIPALPARFVAVRKTEEAAAAARKRVLHERSRKGGTVDPRTLEATGYIFVLTSLEDSVTPAQVLDLYRFRWQVELAFKRLKSILQFDQLPAKDPALARTTLYAKLLAAFLLEDYTTKFLAIFPWGYPLRTS